MVAKLHAAWKNH